MKHPVMAGQQASVKLALENPDEARRSRADAHVLLFYKAGSDETLDLRRHKGVNDEAFLITAYPTDAIREGARVWPQ